MIKVVSQKSDAVIIHDDKSKKQQTKTKTTDKNKRQKLSMTKIRRLN